MDTNLLNGQRCGNARGTPCTRVMGIHLTRKNYVATHKVREYYILSFVIQKKKKNHVLNENDRSLSLYRKII